MPYNSGTGAYERRATTVIDATPDGDTVAVAVDVKLDQGIDDYVTDLNHHKTNGNHYPATSVDTDSRFLGQTPAGVVEWKDGVPAPDAALKDFSNVASGAIAPAKIAQDASNRFVSDTEKAVWNANNINLGVSYPIAGGETAIDFGSDSDPIPPGVKRITIMLSDVSTSGTSGIACQIGDSGGIEVTGYKSSFDLFSSFPETIAATTGFGIVDAVSATDITIGAVTLCRVDSNVWLLSGCGATSGTPRVFVCGGSKSLSHELDRVRVTTINGTDQFDAGTINISWEF